MTDHNVLYIVEGKDEKRLLDRIWNRFDPHRSYDVFVYNTNIHVLINSLFDGDNLDEDLEIVRELRSKETDESNRALLQKKFEYVYMIFDFDPQDSKTNFGKIARMMDFFSDPADNGRLYINYPMMEAYRHIVSFPDDGFKDRKVSLDLLKRGEYKKLVDSECSNELKQLNIYTREHFWTIIDMHLSKLNYILNGVYKLMDKSVFLSLTGSELLDKQIESLEQDETVFVINTSIFTIVEYSPSLFFGLSDVIARLPMEEGRVDENGHTILPPDPDWTWGDEK